MQKWMFSPSQRAVDAVALAIVLVAAVSTSWLYPKWPSLLSKSDVPSVPREPLSIKGATLNGNPTARVVLIEYSDYQCPFCKVAETSIMPQLVRKYVDSGIVQLAFRHAPLEQLHPRAKKAAEAALCAGRQDRFWEMHSALFAHQERMDDESLVTRARALELDVDTFARCLEGAASDQVQEDSREAERLGLRGRPVFLIGARIADSRVRISHVLVGAQPVEEFQAALDEARQAHGSRPHLRLWLAGVGLALIVGLGVVIRGMRLQTGAVTP